MTPEQRKEHSRLVSLLVQASEELGGVDGSYGWNAVYFKQQKAQEALDAFVNSL